MPLRSKSKGKLPKNKVFIYNVSKKLVNEKGDSRIVNFKYDKSSDGYGNFVVDKSCMTESANPNFYNITIPIGNKMRINYKDFGKLTAIDMTPEDIKKTFESTRFARQKSQTTPANTNSRLTDDFEDMFVVPNVGQYDNSFNF